MPVITAQTLRFLLSCERRAWLDVRDDPALRAEPQTPAPFAAIGRAHERAVHAATTGPVEAIPVKSWDEGVALTRDLMQRGAPILLGAYLEVVTPLDLTDRVFTLRGRVDRLVRAPLHGAEAYFPVEIKYHAQPEDADWLQLDFYAWLLGEIQGAAPSGELWLGANADGVPRRRLPHEYDEERLMGALARLLDLEARPEIPPGDLTARCQHCPALALCEAAAESAQRLDLLYRVSQRQRAALQEAGLTHLAHVAARPVEELQQVRGVGATTARQIRANAQAWLEQRPVWYAPPPAPCLEPGWMLDLETLSDGTPWCMGLCDVTGETQIALVAPVQLPEPLTLPDGQRVTLVPDSDCAWEVICEAVSGSDAPIFHWSAFDAGILRSTGPAPVRAALEPRMHDLYRSFAACLRLPTRSLSIKIVSTFLGFEWVGYNDWFAAYADYRYWLDSGRPDVLMRACMYQRADVQSMAHVWRWMQAHLPGGETP